MLGKNKIILFTFLILADQLSKYLIRHSSGFYICNFGVAFGIKIPDIIFWIFWLAIIFFILFGLYKKCFLHSTLYILLILAGAVSNIIDRLYFGCIIDFIDLKIWPVFNLADVFITLGVILLIFSFYKETSKSSLTKKT